MLQGTQFKREVAVKTSVAGILKGEFAENEGGRSLLIGGRHARRVSILATIVDKSGQESQAYKSAVIDDGTAQIKLRFFDNEPWLFEKTEIGDFALIVGKPRSYGSESYIAPEIIKPLKDVRWAEVRRIELLMNVTPAAKKASAMEEKKRENEPDAVNMDKLQIYQLTMELDTGRGADITEVISKAGKGSAEATIKEMLKAGDIFEVTPGKIKVLE